MKRRKATTARQRPGFSLVEMLVVVLIIMTLMAMSFPALHLVIAGQRQRTSEVTVQKARDHLLRHWNLVVDRAGSLDETIPDAFVSSSTVSDVRRKEWVLARLAQEFPITFVEAGAPATPLEPLYATALAGASGIPAASESAVCLALALQKKRGGLATDPEQLFASNERVARSNGLFEIVDAWGTPLAFSRQVSGDKFVPVIISAGKDKTLSTSDDIDSRTIR